MKSISSLLLAMIFCLIGVCSSVDCKACDPYAPNKLTDTTAAKKSPVKIPTATNTPAGKGISKKDNRKNGSSNGSPFSWSPTLLY